VRLLPRLAGVGAAAAVAAAALPPGSASADPPSATEQLDTFAQSSPENAEIVATLRGSGITDEQVLQLLQDPASVVEWETTYIVPDDIEITDEPEGESVPLGDGTFATPTQAEIDQAQASEHCHSVTTNHDGSAFSQRAARLTLTTHWCHKGSSLTGTPWFTHRSSVTLYGNAGGWRVNPSYSGNKGWIGSGPGRDYITEAKADWRLLACLIPGRGCVQVQSGTAYARHKITNLGGVVKSQGGWP
jgi:hypothetical protein